MTAIERAIRAMERADEPDRRDPNYWVGTVTLVMELTIDIDPDMDCHTPEQAQDRAREDLAHVLRRAGKHFPLIREIELTGPDRVEEAPRPHGL